MKSKDLIRQEKYFNVTQGTNISNVHNELSKSREEING